ncbi:hypothetical protein D3C76_1237340 [compost metagenome]
MAAGHLQQLEVAVHPQLLIKPDLVGADRLVAETELRRDLLAAQPLAEQLQDAQFPGRQLGEFTRPRWHRWRRRVGRVAGEVASPMTDRMQGIAQFIDGVGLADIGIGTGLQRPCGVDPRLLGAVHQQPDAFMARP